MHCSAKLGTRGQWNAGEGATAPWQTLRSYLLAVSVFKALCSRDVPWIQVSTGLHGSKHLGPQDSSLLAWQEQRALNLAEGEYAELSKQICLRLRIT